MRVLGISAFYHDSAAALVDERGIVAAAQEERFSRKKHDSGFPQAAIAYCLEESGVSRIPYTIQDDVYLFDTTLDGRYRIGID